jgi:predicted helicase
MISTKNLNQQDGVKIDLRMTFVLKDSRNILEYGNFWGITEVFKHCNSGIQTKRDKLTIQLTREGLRRVLHDFQILNNDEIRSKYNLPADGRDWSIEHARRNLVNTNYNDDNLRQIHYRPFDIRWTYFTNKTKGFLAYPRYETMVNYINGRNYGLVFSRQVVCDTWRHIFVTAQMPEGCLVSIKTREWTYTTPLYMYRSDEIQPRLLEHEEEWRIPNFNGEFIKFINSQYGFKPSPEQILSYIYAVLHSPTYRKKYDDFLKIDFPRIPFTNSVDIFRSLCVIGQELVEHHLMQRSYANNICQFEGAGTNHKVEKISYKNKRVFINKDRYFSPVAKDIWNFHIGGYQVLYQHLKEKHKNHTDVDAKQFLQVANIVDNTIKIIVEIDELTGQWI